MVVLLYFVGIYRGKCVLWWVLWLSTINKFWFYLGSSTQGTPLHLAEVSVAPLLSTAKACLSPLPDCQFMMVASKIMKTWVWCSFVGMNKLINNQGQGWGYMQSSNDSCWNEAWLMCLSRSLPGFLFPCICTIPFDHNRLKLTDKINWTFF